MKNAGRPTRSALSVAACLLLVACAADGVSSPDGQSPGTDASPTAAASAIASTDGETHAPDAAPPELAGRWRRNVLGETVILTLDGTGYHIQRGPESGKGRISVDGDEIEFYGSNRCGGRGTYTWSVDDGRLRLTELVADPCDGRTNVFLRGTFGRVDE